MDNHIAFPNIQYRWNGNTACLIGGQGLGG